jgi:hypothetical protein
MDTDKPNEKLPTASTCFNILRLPAYTNDKIMKDKVLYAINSNAGFELVWYFFYKNKTEYIKMLCWLNMKTKYISLSEAWLDKHG